MLSDSNFKFWVTVAIVAGALTAWNVLRLQERVDALQQRITAIEGRK